MPWRFLWTLGISAATMTALIQVMAWQGYSCSFNHLKAALASGKVGDFVTADAMCRQTFGHACGGPSVVGAGSPTQNLHQAVVMWSQRGRAITLFLCN